MPSARFLKGTGIIVGLMFGAGVFALPLAFAKAGVFWGGALFFIALGLILLLHFLYAEISFYTKGNHRFTGYVGLILGKKSKLFSLFLTAAFYYGTLLIYGVFGGVFLSKFFRDSHSFFLTVLFFAFGSFLVLLKLEKIALVNFFLTIPLFAFIVYLSVRAFPFINLGNFHLGLNTFTAGSGWFLPYGVWLFSLAAFSSIPEARDIFVSSPLRKLKGVILFSVLVSSFFYCLFVFSVVGVSGQDTSNDALSGISGILGNDVVLGGALMGFLAVFTSFLALGADLRDLFRYDFGFSGIRSWFFVAVPPVLLFILGAQNFTLILRLAGSLGIGLVGIFIILMARKLREKKVVKRGLRVNGVLEALAMVAILTAVVYEIWSLF